MDELSAMVKCPGKLDRPRTKIAPQLKLHLSPRGFRPATRF